MISLSLICRYFLQLMLCLCLYCLRSLEDDYDLLIKTNHVFPPEILGKLNSVKLEM